MPAGFPCEGLPDILPAGVRDAPQQELASVKRQLRTIIRLA
ncbi:hypothetical protein PSE_0553 [Pseudovibrio sp. FO-BEG1]|nr:hypothetical protein PSE_0553 [Pseudovibrio sp. FO-BEG1]